jgi:hypothetical protein
LQVVIHCPKEEGGRRRKKGEEGGRRRKKEGEGDGREKGDEVHGVLFLTPDRGFTPKLVETYNTMKAKEIPFEIIFVSSDNSEEQFTEYWGEMPWLAIPFEDKRCSKLSEFFEVQGIPMLAIVDPKNGNVITTNGRGAVSSDPEGNEFPWHPKPLMNVEEAGDVINDVACFLYLDDHVTEENKGALERVASQYIDTWKAEGKERVCSEFLCLLSLSLSLVRTFLSSLPFSFSPPLVVRTLLAFLFSFYLLLVFHRLLSFPPFLSFSSPRLPLFPPFPLSLPPCSLPSPPSPNSSAG